MTDLGFQMFDADNHYYESEDAFTRYDSSSRPIVRWATIDGKKRLMYGDRMMRMIADPTFSMLSQPGATESTFRGGNPEGKDIREAYAKFGHYPIQPEFRDRDARLKLMDEQGIEATIMLPTVAITMEELLADNPAATYQAMHAFNLWLEDDWGFAYKNRIFSVPMLSLIDLPSALGELDFLLKRGARFVHLRAGPVPVVWRSPADPMFDPFWARVEEAGVPVVYHAWDFGYINRYGREWSEPQNMPSHLWSPFTQVALYDRPLYETFAALCLQGVFERFPNVRVVSIENGSDWAVELVKKMTKVMYHFPKTFKTHPVELFKQHVYISPYYEDDLRALADTIGADKVLMGSDYPHPEGLARPADYVNDLKGFSPQEIRMVMRENGMGLAGIREAVPA